MSNAAQSKPALRLEWDFGDNAPAGASRLLALLAEIETTGSIAGAARATGLSYRNAWGLINAWQTHFGQSLVATARASGSTLDDFAHRMLAIDRSARQMGEASQTIERTVAEVGRVLSARRHLGALKPTTATPSGWVRHLVRVALVSSSAVMGSSMALLSVAAPLRSSTAAAAAPAAPAAAHESSATVRAAGPSTLRSTGRDTPYSVAVTLGDAALRDRIIELNRGSRTPDGGTWTGGVFPSGMVVEVPAGMLDAGPTTWEAYTVVEGDSVYRIAAALSPSMLPKLPWPSTSG